MCCLRFLREFEKWSWLGKIGKNEEKWGKNEENGCPRIPIYTLLTNFKLFQIERLC